MTEEQAAQSDCAWQCHDCLNKWNQQSPAFKALLELPHDVLFRILEFTERPTHHAGVLVHQLALVTPVARHFILQDNNNSRELWDSILQHDYQLPLQQAQDIRSEKSLWTKKRGADRKGTIFSSAAILKAARSTSTTTPRKSTRKRIPTDFLSPCTTPGETLVSCNSIPMDSGHNNNKTINKQHPRYLVQQHHLALLARTEDAFQELEVLVRVRVNGGNLQLRRAALAGQAIPLRLLTLQRTRHILSKYAPIDVNRPLEATGRTLLQVICAGELSENVIVQCVQHLLQAPYYADPNLLSRNEAPYADRPTLYFAIARVMPKLVETILVHNNSSNKNHSVLTSRITGKFRMTFDTSKVITGSFTPLEYALEMHRVEVTERESRPPSNEQRTVQFLMSPYWKAQLQACIDVLRRFTPVVVNTRHAASLFKTTQKKPKSKNKSCGTSRPTSNGDKS